MANKKTNTEDEEENVRVFIRVRPLNKKELQQEHKNIVSVDREGGLISLSKPGVDTEKPKVFKFDHIFPDDSTQMDLYRHVAMPVVDKVLNGYNGTIFAYGQTGTGKTYTMAGFQKKEEMKGIIPNTFSHIFTQIARSSGEKSFVVTVTYLEIYNEDVRDLLGKDPSAKLEVRERPDVGIFVKDLCGFTVNSIESITELMNRGNTNRITRSTLMNDVSSRSHAIFTIRVESKNRIDNKTTIGKLNLVDLAGSERLSRTQATGERLREASSINQSLSVLGNVISALVDVKSTHIPYRNSKLTRLLKDSLGGNSKTAMIAMVSPSEVDYEESICTLRYASRVKYIKNRSHINIENKQGLIECFENEIAELQKRISILDIEEDREIKVLAQKEKKEKDRIKTEEILKKEAEIAKTEMEKAELLDKIARIQEKILVGGENLYLKAQHQEFLLKTTDVELENLEKTHQQLEETLRDKGAERIDIEEKYSSLQEEDVGITKKIKKIQVMLNDAKEEYADKEHEYQREIESLHHNNRVVNRELQLVNLMIDQYIPKEYLKKIEANLQWNPETAEYQMKGVAYTGNNMKKNFSAESEKIGAVKPKMKPVYLSYSKSERVRPATSYVPRPKKWRGTDVFRSDARKSAIPGCSRMKSPVNADKKGAFSMLILSDKGNNRPSQRAESVDVISAIDHMKGSKTMCKV